MSRSSAIRFSRPRACSSPIIRWFQRIANGCGRGRTRRRTTQTTREGTRLGRQELNAEILDDVPGALWSRALIEETRWPVHRNIPDLVRIVVAIDPAVSTGEDADETGIVVAGKDANGHGYVLADQSGRYPPTEWARTAIALYRQHKADRIVAEVNNGGDRSFSFAF